MSRSRLLRRAALRLVQGMLVVVGVVTLTFVLSRAIPGDPARMLLGPQASAADVDLARKELGLDQPLARQYVTFWARLVHVGDDVSETSTEHRSCTPALDLGARSLHIDLGFSPQYRRPVADVLADKIPRSVELALAALFVQLTLGLFAGVLASAKPGSRIDEASIGLTLVGISTPTFVLGVLLQYVLAYKMQVLPYDGYGATSEEHAAALVLPALTLGLYGAATYARITRDEMLGIMSSHHVRTARAKGASPGRVLVVHGLRNALLPIATLAAMDLGTLVGGAIVTEQVFRWPGVGQMAVYALQNRDGPLIIGTVLFTSVAVVVASLIVDGFSALLDPRLRRPV